MKILCQEANLRPSLPRMGVGGGEDITFWLNKWELTMLPEEHNRRVSVLSPVPTQCGISLQGNVTVNKTCSLSWLALLAYRSSVMRRPSAETEGYPVYILGRFLWGRLLPESSSWRTIEYLQCAPPHDRSDQSSTTPPRGTLVEGAKLSIHRN